MMFTWSISLGNILTILSILGIGIKSLMALRRLDRLIWEHELMWREYASTHSLPVKEV